MDTTTRPVYMVQHLLLAICAIALPQPSDAAPPVGVEGTNPKLDGLNLKVGDAFIDARARIIQAGWKPIRMHVDGQYDYVGTEREVVERGFHEVDSCSMDAGSLCNLYYRKAGDCLLLNTVGEQVQNMKIRLWKRACPTENR